MKDFANVKTESPFQKKNPENIWKDSIFSICKKLEVQSLEELLKAFQPINNPGRFYPEASNLLNEKL